MSNHLKGILLTVLGVIILSPDALLVKLIEADGWAILFWRGILFFVGISLLLFAMYGTKAITEYKNIGTSGLLIGLILGFSSICFVLSLTYTSIANTLIIVSTSPIMTAIISRIVLGEKASMLTLVSMVTIFFGMVIVVSEDLDGFHIKGDLLALASSIFLGAMFTIIRKYKTTNMVPAVAVSGIVCFVVASVFIDSWGVSFNSAIYILLMGIIATVSFTLIAIAPRYISATQASIIMPLETILGILWAWFVIDEQLSAEIVVGGFIVISTLFIHAFYSANKDNS